MTTYPPDSAAPAHGLQLVLLEDDDLLRDRILLPRLTQFGFHVRATGSAAGLHALVGQRTPDLFVLDIGLPDGDGFTLARSLRGSFPEAGIVILTGRGDSVDRVRGLFEGADAYLAKPVEIEVLVATLQSVARRVLPVAAAKAMSTSDWSLDPKGWRLVHPCGAAVLLTKSERKFIACLLEHRDDVVPRETLVRALTEDVYDFDLHRLDNLLHRLRRKVKSASDAPLPITSVHGEGYVWVSG